MTRKIKTFGEFYAEQRSKDKMAKISLEELFAIREKQVLERMRQDQIKAEAEAKMQSQIGSPDYYKHDAHFGSIPPHMHEPLVRYVMDGIMPGSFLEAVMANDLMRAVGCADYINVSSLQGWAAFVYNDTPAECHGSYEAVNNWCERGGLNGKAP